MKKRVLEYELPIKISSQKGGGYLAVSPGWSDCYAQGDTLDEAVLEITAVAQSLIELYKEEGKKIPLKESLKQSIFERFSIPVVMEA